MNRSGKILVTAHCILNANAKVYPLADVGGASIAALAPYLQDGVGLLQLPCPELTYLGMKRWGMTKEQYDHPNYRDHCRRILNDPLVQIKAFLQVGYELVGVMGVDGSPNCGVNLTCMGYCGGEICNAEAVIEQIKKLEFVDGQGVFIEELMTLLHQSGLSPRLLAIRERDASATG